MLGRDRRKDKPETCLYREKNFTGRHCADSRDPREVADDLKHREFGGDHRGLSTVLAANGRIEDRHNRRQSARLLGLR
jgi:hypothetical protein